ncbi:MAG: ester cyclase [Alphaproteobacteria bacterium]|nr:ester cyclase [Alphaproteobacteria bacterium]MCW5744353.1 ester cyclase [Alphaproteobacteria bacterium]
MAEPLGAQLVRRFYDEVWNHADEAVAREILAADLSFRGSIGEERAGAEGFIDYMRKIHRAFADYHCRIDHLVADADSAAARMTFGGLHCESLWGEKPTGHTVTWTGAAFFTVKHGQIATIWVLGDTETLRRQLRGTK